MPLETKVGYEAHAYDLLLRAAGGRQEAIVFTHFAVVREDAQLLYGFNNKQERTLFKEPIKRMASPGAGARSSGMSAQQFRRMRLSAKSLAHW